MDRLCWDRGCKWSGYTGWIDNPIIIVFPGLTGNWKFTEWITIFWISWMCVCFLFSSYWTTRVGERKVLRSAAVFPPAQCWASSTPPTLLSSQNGTTLAAGCLFIGLVSTGNDRFIVGLCVTDVVPTLCVQASGALKTGQPSRCSGSASWHQRSSPWRQRHRDGVWKSYLTFKGGVYVMPYSLILSWPERYPRCCRYGTKSLILFEPPFWLLVDSMWLFVLDYSSRILSH